MAEENRIKLPGFGLPVDSMSEHHTYGEQRFPHAIADYFSIDGVTIREQTMLEFVNQITDKPKWIVKVHDESVVEKWRNEACGTVHQQQYSDQHLSKKCFDYCIAELRDKAKYLKEHGVVHVLDVIATVVKADMAETDDFSNRLNQAVHPLEHVPDFRKDWHPGSDGLVLDLVHPSLCPLIYGKSRVLPHGTVPLEECNEWSGCGEICPDLEHCLQNKHFARSLGTDEPGLQPWGHYQWLPSDVRFSDQGNAKIDSYINNLHPQHHRELYRVLEQAVDKALPLWNECLSFWHDRLRLKVDNARVEDYRRKSLTIADLDGVQVSQADPQSPEENGGDDEQSDEDNNMHEFFDDAERDWLMDNPDKRELSQPDSHKPFTPFAEHEEKHGSHRRDISRDFPDGLKVIFELANIHLTPEKPRYDGSAWHVEGALNEHICATALFYYDQDNIEASYLEFQHEIDDETMIMKPGQDEYITCEDLYGIAHDGAPVQSIGRVLTRQSRILAFPNVMQHRVQPFSLADPTKPGHRKILALFLIDPTIRILSTSNVPPQQRAWWADAVRTIEPFDSLPVELFERIIADVEDFPIDWDEACEIREALMAERGRIREEFEEALGQNTFFFGEH